jgi:hypothetical protein
MIAPVATILALVMPVAAILVLVTLVATIVIVSARRDKTSRASVVHP